MQNKRGLSGVVTALILIVLVLVAVGIVWAVYNSLIKGSAEDIEYSEKCLGIDIQATSLDCTGTSCIVGLERASGSGGDAIDGVGLTFSDATQSSDEKIVSGNVAVTSTITKDVGFVATSVDVRVYFNKTKGGTYFCSQTNTFEA